MTEVFSERIRRFVAAVGPEPTALQREMATYSDEGEFEFGSFPIVGPEVGGWLALLARLVDAERVLELGSGFGYSATWFLRALPPHGEVVLTELDEGLAETGREFLDRAEGGHRATYEVGEALSVVERYPGPFDVVLVDLRKREYPRAFDAARDRLAPGGLLLADNMTVGPFDVEDVLAGIEGTVAPTDEQTAGVVEFVERVRDAPEFASALLPVGSGLCVAHRTE